MTCNRGTWNRPMWESTFKIITVTSNCQYQNYQITSASNLLLIPILCSFANCQRQLNFDDAVTLNAILQVGRETATWLNEDEQMNQWWLLFESGDRAGNEREEDGVESCGRAGVGCRATGGTAAGKARKWEEEASEKERKKERKKREAGKWKWRVALPNKYRMPPDVAVKPAAAPPPLLPSFAFPRGFSREPGAGTCTHRPNDATLLDVHWWYTPPRVTFFPSLPSPRHWLSLAKFSSEQRQSYAFLTGTRRFRVVASALIDHSNVAGRFECFPANFIRLFERVSYIYYCSV